MKWGFLGLTHSIVTRGFLKQNLHAVHKTSNKFGWAFKQSKIDCQRQNMYLIALASFGSIKTDFKNMLSSL